MVNERSTRLTLSDSSAAAARPEASAPSREGAPLGAAGRSGQERDNRSRISSRRVKRSFAAKRTSSVAAEELKAGRRLPAGTSGEAGQRYPQTEPSRAWKLASGSTYHSRTLGPKRLGRVRGSWWTQSAAIAQADVCAQEPLPPCGSLCARPAPRVGGGRGIAGPAAVGARWQTHRRVRGAAAISRSRSPRRSQTKSTRSRKRGMEFDDSLVADHGNCAR
jgi:hypothetical protein